VAPLEIGIVSVAARGGSYARAMKGIGEIELVAIADDNL
jgi:hypothetical protein